MYDAHAENRTAIVIKERWVSLWIVIHGSDGLARKLAEEEHEIVSNKHGLS